MEPGFYEIHALGAADLGGVTGARPCQLNGIVKTDVAGTGEYTVANEFIAGRLASMLGLPCPPGSVVKMNDGQLGYAMMRFGRSGEKLPPVNPADVVAAEPVVAAGITMFDNLIMNTDRHNGNLAYQVDVGVGIYDHSHALLGTARGTGKAHVEGIGTSPVFSGCLLPHLTDSTALERWADRIGNMSEYAIDQVCSTARKLTLITREEATAVRDVLTARKGAARLQLSQARASFPGIGDWGMTA
jgi:hypothetical protein